MPVRYSGFDVNLTFSQQRLKIHKIDVQMRDSVCFCEISLKCLTIVRSSAIWGVILRVLLLGHDLADKD